MCVCVCTQRYLTPFRRSLFLWYKKKFLVFFLFLFILLCNYLNNKYKKSGSLSIIIFHLESNKLNINKIEEKNTRQTYNQLNVTSLHSNAPAIKIYHLIFRYIIKRINLPLSLSLILSPIISNKANQMYVYCFTSKFR